METLQNRPNEILENTCIDVSFKQENLITWNDTLRWPDVCDFIDWLDKDWPNEMGHLTSKDVLKLSHSNKLP